MSKKVYFSQVSSLFYDFILRYIICLFILFFTTTVFSFSSFGTPQETRTFILPERFWFAPQSPPSEKDLEDWEPVIDEFLSQRMKSTYFNSRPSPGLAYIDPIFQAYYWKRRTPHLDWAESLSKRLSKQGVTHKMVPSFVFYQDFSKLQSIMETRLIAIFPGGGDVLSKFIQEKNLQGRKIHLFITDRKTLVSSLDNWAGLFILDPNAIVVSEDLVTEAYASGNWDGVMKVLVHEEGHGTLRLGWDGMRRGGTSLFDLFYGEGWGSVSMEELYTTPLGDVVYGKSQEMEDKNQILDLVPARQIPRWSYIQKFFQTLARLNLTTPENWVFQSQSELLMRPELSPYTIFGGEEGLFFSFQDKDEPWSFFIKATPHFIQYPDVASYRLRLLAIPKGHNRTDFMGNFGLNIPLIEPTHPIVAEFGEASYRTAHRRDSKEVLGRLLLDEFLLQLRELMEFSQHQKALLDSLNQVEKALAIAILPRTSSFSVGTIERWFPLGPFRIDEKRALQVPFSNLRLLSSSEKTLLEERRLRIHLVQDHLQKALFQALKGGGSHGFGEHHNLEDSQDSQAISCTRTLGAQAL